MQIDRRLATGGQLGHELAGDPPERPAHMLVAKGVQHARGARRAPDDGQRIGHRGAEAEPVMRTHARADAADHRLRRALDLRAAFRGRPGGKAA